MDKRASISREKLYEEVWAEPMITVALRYEVSGSFLARICTRQMFLVLRGGSRGVVRILPNLLVMTGKAVYGNPEVNDIIAIA